ncbi:MAG: exodeoxyribonuclease VII small subunit [Acidimicrobiia bacterium]
MSEPKFEDTMSELSAIVEELERGSVPLDELTTKVTRGNELVSLGKAQLEAVRGEVTEIISEHNL